MKQEKDHSLKQQVYLYQVILSNSTYYLYLPQLNQISLGFRSFTNSTSITLQSTFAFSLFPILDVPFINGNYSVYPNKKHPRYGNGGIYQTFYQALSNITSDESTPSFYPLTNSIPIPQK